MARFDATGLLDAIYEAGAQPQYWPGVLSDLGRACGAAGGLFFTKSASGLSWTAAPEVVWIIEDYIAQGWMNENERGAPLLVEMHPGFQTDSDFRDAGQRAAMPVYRDFLIPNGIDAGAGTVIQGAGDDAIMLVMEGFGSHEQAIAAVPFLDRLRPHLARALTLSARLQAHEARMIVDGIALLGTGAAIVGEGGRLQAANSLFNDRLGNEVVERQNRLAFLSADTDLRFTDLLARYRGGAIAAQSLPLRPRAGGMPFVLHVVPLRGRASDAFSARGLLIVLADGHNANVPSADLLRVLFDLTPAEARLARRLLEGDSLVDATRALGVKEATTRSQLKAIFTKTGVSRQAELVRLLAGYGMHGAIGG
ncbi:MAG: helix-turn-helix transcriptional regulator [Sphingomonadaceae bacterium]|nr:helix-turn-helix transcriptional regulator [Sphingomonadaceae bacterium]